MIPISDWNGKTFLINKWIKILNSSANIFRHIHTQCLSKTTNIFIYLPCLDYICTCTHKKPNIHIHVYLYVYIQLYTHMFACIYTLTHIFACIDTFTHIHIYLHVHKHSHTCTHTCTNIYMQGTILCMFACTVLLVENSNGTH